jgi:hypothetical protein
VSPDSFKKDDPATTDIAVDWPGPGACCRAGQPERGARVGPRSAGAITRRAAKAVKP